jgi:Polyketide cyclase / dehydrase and lipid transport
MASIVHDFIVDATQQQAWAALSKVGEVNKLITFLGPVTLDGDVRRIDMGEYGVIEELIVSVDDEWQRVTYSIQKSSYALTHHHSSMQVFPVGAGTSGGSRFVWILDLKPDAMAAVLAPGVENAVEAIKKSLAGVSARVHTSGIDIGERVTAT